MNAADFDKIVNETCDSIRKVLSSKAKEYAKGDRLYNFKRAAEINHTTPELALAGMLVKHWVSVLDLVEGTLENTEAMVNEKVGDTINYLVLLKAILQEKRDFYITFKEDVRAIESAIQDLKECSNQR